MNKKALVKQLQTLKNEIRPNQEWLASNRSILVSQITAQTTVDAPQTLGQRVVQHLRPFSIFIRPVGALAFAVVVGFGAWIASVNATRNSLPGDILYPLKLTAERVQINLEGDTEKKTALEIAFASRRLTEVAAVTQKAKNGSDGNDSLVLPLAKFQENLASVKSNLEQIKLQDPKRAAELADYVDNKTEEYIHILEDKNTVGTGDTAAVQQAIEKSKVANEAAVKVILTGSDVTDGSNAPVTPAKVLNKIQDKLTAAQDGIDKAKARIDELKKQGITTVPVIVPPAPAGQTAAPATDETPSSDTAPAPSAPDQKPQTVSLSELVSKLDEARSALDLATLSLKKQDADGAFDSITKANGIVDDVNGVLSALDQPSDDKAVEIKPDVQGATTGESIQSPEAPKQTDTGTDGSQATGDKK